MTKKNEIERAGELTKVYERLHQAHMLYRASQTLNPAIERPDISRSEVDDLIIAIADLERQADYLQKLPADFRAAITKLGMTPSYTARFFSMGATAGRRWAKDGPPEYVGMWIDFMLVIQRDLHIEDVPAWVNLMLGRKMEKRRKVGKTAP